MIVDCATYRDGRRVESTPPSLAGALQTARTCGDASAFLWLGLFEPDAAELAQIAEEFELHPLAVEDAMSPHQRPKIDRYTGSLFAVLHTLQEPDPQRPLHLGEISVFLGANFVVTVRYGDANPLSQVRERVEQHPDLLKNGPGAVLYAVADSVVDSYVEYAAKMQATIDALETEVFSPTRGDYGAPIYALKRNAIVFGRAVTPLLPALLSLSRGPEPSVSPESLPYFNDVTDHVERVVDYARDWNQLLDHMLDADRSRVSVQQNNDMRRISAWAAIAAVPTAIAGIYGMNFVYMPELNFHYAYFVVLGVMATTCIGIYVLLKRAKWL